MWLATPEWKHIATTIWQHNHHGSISHIICQKLKFCGKALQNWHNTKFRNLDTQITKIENDIDLLWQQLSHGAPVTDDWQLKEKDMLQHYNILLEMKHLKWEQRARGEQIKWGDANSKYFHAMVVKRRRQNIINQIKHQDGTMLRDPDKIAQTFVSYYTNLF